MLFVNRFRNLIAWRILVSFIIIFGYLQVDGCAQKTNLKISNIDKPNILLINIDDLGWRDVGYMGSQYYETPNIDELSTQGMVFTNAYSASSNCAPSRASLFSGQWSPRTGIYTVRTSKRGKSENRKIEPTENRKHFKSDIVTFTQVLKKNGYRTGHFGKWHISKDPTDFGFDVNFGGAEYGHPPHPGGYFSPWHNRNLKDAQRGKYLTDYLTDKAIEYIGSNKSKPFFINFAPYAVHSPYQPKQKLLKNYQKKRESYGQNDPAYAAMIETMDTNVGRLIDFLKKAGKFKNTFIIFTSDNGGVYRVTKQWPLRAGKGSFYEGGVRVPMLVIWPDKIKRNSFTNKPVINTDFYPTFLDVANISKPNEKLLDGRSLVPLLRGKPFPSKPLFWHFPIYLESFYAEKQSTDPCFRTRPGSSVRSGSWVLQQYYEDDTLELYNLDMDLGQRKNLVQIYPQKTKELKKLLDNWKKKVGAPVPTKINSDFEPGNCPDNTLLEWNTRHNRSSHEFDSRFK